jgi:hypothetical protein
MRRLAAVLFVLTVCHAGNANAQVPAKTITIYNNSGETIYPLLSGYIGAVDLWLQARFKVTDADKQTFCNVDLGNRPCTDHQSRVPRLYRAYINPDDAPHSFSRIASRRLPDVRAEIA